MAYIVEKQNVKSSRRTYKSTAALVRACLKVGAVSAEVRGPEGKQELVVRWEPREVVYPITPEGVVDYRLAWDLA